VDDPSPDRARGGELTSPISRGFTGRRRPTVDIHCVTKWSKFDTHWKGVSVDTLLESVGTEAEYVTAFSDGG
jgi:hypothetical protein